MALLVQKFGGSSLATPRHIQRAAERVRDVRLAGHEVVVVASAMGRMTDHLVNLAHRTVSRPPQREMDMLLTAGERVSMSLLAMALQDLGVPAISFTGSQSGILTTSRHSEARILEIRPTRIREEISKGKVVIIAGFQGVSREKEITTLGRGGSDTTAVALAAALGADRCDVLTDVDGIFSADPRLVPDAQLIPSCSYEEALEFSSLGAKMHARSLDVARRFGVVVRVASNWGQPDSGTWIRAHAQDGNGENMEQTVIRGIGTQSGHCYFRIQKNLAEVLPILSQSQVALRCFSAASGHLELVCESSRASALQEALDQSATQYEILMPVSIVSAVGEGICGSVEMVPQFLEALQSVGARCLVLALNSLSVQAAVPSEYAASVTQALHRRFIDPDSALGFGAQKSEPAKLAGLLQQTSEASPIQ
jgi:aspartate kinase